MRVFLWVRYLQKTHYRSLLHDIISHRDDAYIHRKPKAGEITVYKAYRYRLYPTDEQEGMFANTFGCVRFIHNKMLGDRIDYYKETGKTLNNTPAQYKEEFPWLREVDSLALTNAQINLNKTYSNFFNNRKHFGKPRFKSKKTSYASYSTNNQNGTVRIEGNKVRLPKVGWVKLCLKILHQYFGEVRKPSASCDTEEFPWLGFCHARPVCCFR